MAKQFLQKATPTEIIDTFKDDLLKAAENLYEQAQVISRFLSGVNREDRREFQDPVSNFMSSILEARRVLHGRPRECSSLMKVIRSLECQPDGTCLGCGAKTYSDSCVLLRPGVWAHPRSFHKDNCVIDRILQDFTKEVIADEKVDDVLDAPKRKKFVQESIRRTKELLSSEDFDRSEEVCTDQD